MKAVEFPLGNLREYFFNEILSKMTPRMDHNSPPSTNLSCMVGICGTICYYI